jgi:pilus assembly protein Flp/PilA
MHARTERGASAVEYGLLVAGIAAVIAIAVYGLGRISGEQMGNGCNAVGGQITTALGTAGSSAPCQN